MFYSENYLQKGLPEAEFFVAGWFRLIHVSEIWIFVAYEVFPTKTGFLYSQVQFMSWNLSYN